MNNQLNATKYMLSILDIEYLIDNTYIVHFIDKELIKTRKI